MSILTADWPYSINAGTNKDEIRRIEYKACGTCCKQIDVEIDGNNRIASVKFHGGCNGNTQGVSRLVCGMDADEARRRLTGVICGNKGTSCPDQLAKAIAELEKR